MLQLPSAAKFTGQSIHWVRHDAAPASHPYVVEFTPSLLIVSNACPIVRRSPFVATHKIHPLISHAQM
ncbi:hypothetical protein GCM10023354_06200 [Garicola koreensis]